MQIEKLAPAFKDYLWGGTRLRDIYHKPCTLPKVAESWELSTHPAGESTLSGGRWDGQPLSAYFAQNPQAMGEHCRDFPNFPVLIKFIDARQPLSIQVHPSDGYALREEGEYGKTEMWYVMDCDPGSTLYFGVNRALAQEEFRRRIEDNTVEEVLNRVPVHPGDVFFIEAGTLHAIGAGILICEIQQNSNCTYRVYDYARLGPDGQPRALHIDKALAVSRLTPSPAPVQPTPTAVPGGTQTLLASCPYFTTHRYRVDTTVTLTAGPESFLSLMVMEGSGTAAGPENTVAFAPGDSLLVPAGSGDVQVSGPCLLAVTQV